ncbi:MAG: hypothetical protein GY757_09930 [bacterium]|nr:hypothetical protein [bacterium]
MNNLNGVKTNKVVALELAAGKSHDEIDKIISTALWNLIEWDIDIVECEESILQECDIAQELAKLNTRL